MDTDCGEGDANFGRQVTQVSYKITFSEVTPIEITPTPEEPPSPTPTPTRTPTSSTPTSSSPKKSYESLIQTGEEKEEDEENEGKKGIPLYVIILIIVGALVIFGLVGFLVWKCCCKKGGVTIIENEGIKVDEKKINFEDVPTTARGKREIKNKCGDTNIIRFVETKENIN